MPREPGDPQRPVSTAPTHGGWRAGLGLLGLGLAALLIQLPFYDRWYSWTDEGHMLLFADILAQGGELYRDATLYPLPGAFYLLAWAFELFGTSLRVARVLVVLEFALFVVLVFALLRRSLRPGLAWLGLLLLLLYRIWAFPHWQMYSYSTTALCLLCGAWLAVDQFLVGRRRGALLLAGLLLGLGVACKQDYGAVFFVTLNAVLVMALLRSAGEARRWLPLALFNGPAAAVGLVLMFHYLSEGLLGELLRQTVWGHLSGIATFEYAGLPPLFPLLAQEPLLRDTAGVYIYGPALLSTVAVTTFRSTELFRETLAWDLGLKAFYYLPYLLVLLAAWVPWSRRRAAGPGDLAFLRGLGLWMIGALFLLLLTANRPQDYLHFVVVYCFFLFLLLLLLDGLWARRRRAGALLALLSLGLAGLAAVPSLRLYWGLRVQHTAPIPAPRGGGILVEPDEAQLLGQVVDYIQEQVPPGERLAVMPYFPMAHFLADRLGPHRSSYIVWPVPDHPDRAAHIAAAFDEQELENVVYSFTRFANLPPMPAYAPEIFRYLVEHYEMVEVFSSAPWGYELAGLKREGGAAPGRALLDAERAAGASLWLETAGGPDRAVQGEERSRWLQLGDWPFRPAVALRPAAAPRRTRLELPLEVPPAARLRGAVSTHPDRWFVYPASWVEFELAVREGARRDVLFTRRLDATKQLDDRGWKDFEVSLEAYAGRRVVVELVTGCERASGEALLSAGWAIPRLVAAGLTPRSPAPAASPAARD